MSHENGDTKHTGVTSSSLKRLFSLTRIRYESRVRCAEYAWRKRGDVSGVRAHEQRGGNRDGATTVYLRHRQPGRREYMLYTSTAGRVSYVPLPTRPRKIQHVTPTSQLADSEIDSQTTKSNRRLLYCASLSNTFGEVTGVVGEMSMKRVYAVPQCTERAPVVTLSLIHI